jgi:protein phosphatase methylesterase 1
MRLMTMNALTEWYLHLSQHFLQAKSARLLVLAGQERLDRELMVGQM